jgi:AcrR family transcriptional regulator
VSTIIAAPSKALGDFQRRRKQDSRDSLIAAATDAFCAVGYFAVSVEDIASVAGVSRMTFYRHFRDKAAIAAEIFTANAAIALPRVIAIRQSDFRDREIVQRWISDLFAADRASAQLLRVFIQANVEESGFTQTAQGFIADIIAGLGQNIPAFAISGARPHQRRQWLEAWLLIYEILDQANHAARESGISTDPLVTGILADRFLAFVTREA